MLYVLEFRNLWKLQPKYTLYGNFRKSHEKVHCTLVSFETDMKYTTAFIPCRGI